MTKSAVFLLLLFCIQFQSTLAIYCKDENNNYVDWAVVYKLPKLQSNNALIRSGLAYTFVTSNNASQWKLSQFSINSTQSIVANFLSRPQKQSYAYALYNDQPPQGPMSNKGHTKGVILANTNGGIWLVHSVPHFPATLTRYSYPATGTKFGQSFLCISLDLDNANRIGVQLQYNEPHFYDYNIPDLFQAQLNQIVAATHGIFVNKPPWFHVASIMSKGGANFTSFAKSGRFRKDLYLDWVAPSLRSNLYVETWPNGPGKLASNCTKPFKVYNVEEINVKSANVSFKTTHDHSKWAVSDNLAWICIGDINRAQEQTNRGGGTVCISNATLATDYRRVVNAIEQCHK